MFTVDGVVLFPCITQSPCSVKSNKHDGLTPWGKVEYLLYNRLISILARLRSTDVELSMQVEYELRDFSTAMTRTDFLI